MKPADAKTRLCNFAIAPTPRITRPWNGTISGCDVTITGVNRLNGAPHPASMCIANDCMAWAWMDKISKTEGFCSAGDNNFQDWR
jgi:hypothetical protein